MSASRTLRRRLQQQTMSAKRPPGAPNRHVTHIGTWGGMEFAYHATKGLRIRHLAS